MLQHLSPSASLAESANFIGCWLEDSAGGGGWCRCYSLRAQRAPRLGYLRARAPRSPEINYGRPALAGGYRPPVTTCAARVLAFASTVSGAALVGRRIASRLCAHSLVCAPSAARLRLRSLSLRAFGARLRCSLSLRALYRALLLSLALARCAAPRCFAVL